MARVKPAENRRDIYVCRSRIKAILEEFNCDLMDGDEGTHVLLVDRDTQETISATVVNG